VAERFLATADLPEYDLSGFKPMRFEVEPKSAALNMRRPPKPLAERPKTAALSRRARSPSRGQAASMHVEFVHETAANGRAVTAALATELQRAV
jgi:hypothetical protein